MVIQSPKSVNTCVGNRLMLDCVGDTLMLESVRARLMLRNVAVLR
jgi:hypothetical protein